MGAWVQLLQGRGGGGPSVRAPPGSSSPATTARRGASSLLTRRTVISRNSGGNVGGPSPPPGRGQASGSSSPSINGSSPPEAELWEEKRKKRKVNKSVTTTTAQKQQQQRRQPPSVLEVQRAIGVAPDGDDGRDTRGDGGSRPDSVLDFWASTPIGQAESPGERKLREAAEWVVERTESRGLLGQRLLMVVCLNILPLWVFLLLVASGAVKLPFSLPFMDDLLS